MTSRLFLKKQLPMNRFKYITKLISHYKYLITIVIGTLTVGVIDENSFRQRIIQGLEIRELKKNIAKYNAMYERDSRQLDMLESNPKAIEKIARERYFMKADDEDIFVLSDDETNTDDNNEEAQ